MFHEMNILANRQVIAYNVENGLSSEWSGCI